MPNPVSSVHQGRSRMLCARARESETVSLKLQKRFAAGVLDCGRGKVWLDPNVINEISMANSSNLLSLSQ
ncbi:hypothetical protein Nepgr_001591 [Nepenthes gracilis]|uniref:Ribosomal protein L19e N-terminal domain-containing protein n=1 Tax=Nepenthes gracilis TaxID=150966 RepID=A0AAD3P8R3_NEPGR|nr:hypothetical protein Nepgr_001591 [Nepenthes gracilis]